MGLSKNAGRNVLILLSGGIDSTACVHFYLSQKSDIRALFIDYGQLSAKREARAVERISHHFSIPLDVVSCSGATKKPGGLVLGRNTFLLALGLMEFTAPAGIIALGIHAGTNYFDCSKAFVESMQSVYDTYSGGRIQIGTPFLEWTKREVWDYCKRQKVPLMSTYSCELGRAQPCGKCLSCSDLEKLRACA